MARTLRAVHGSPARCFFSRLYFRSGAWFLIRNVVGPGLSELEAHRVADWSSIGYPATRLTLGLRRLRSQSRTESWRRRRLQVKRRNGDGTHQAGRNAGPDVSPSRQGAVGPASLPLKVPVANLAQRLSRLSLGLRCHPRSGRRAGRRWQSPRRHSCRIILATGHCGTKVADENPRDVLRRELPETPPRLRRGTTRPLAAQRIVRQPAPRGRNKTVAWPRNAH